MSIRAIATIMDGGSPSKGPERLVMLAIARSVDEASSSAFIKVETIAKRAAISVRMAQYYLRRLEDRGEVATELCEGYRGVNRYHLRALSTPARAIAPLGQEPLHPSTPATAIAPHPCNSHCTPPLQQPLHPTPAIALAPREVLERESERERESQDATGQPQDNGKAPMGTPGAVTPQDETARTTAPEGGQQRQQFQPDHAAQTRAWQAHLRCHQAEAHNGQSMEWAEWVKFIGAENWDEAAWLVRRAIMYARKSDPTRKKSFPLCELRGWVVELRRDLKFRRNPADTTKPPEAAHA
jgi:hypothetical protein